MSILTSIKMAMRNISGNKTRAFLTMLGIIIGVSSVIVLVSIGQGSSKAASEHSRTKLAFTLTLALSIASNNRRINKLTKARLSLSIIMVHIFMLLRAGL